MLKSLPPITRFMSGIWRVALTLLAAACLSTLVYFALRCYVSPAAIGEWALASRPHISGNSEQSDLAARIYREQIEQRKAALRKIGRQEYKGMGFHALNPLFVPEVLCVDRVRLGRVDDGGKWVCNPQFLPTSDCVVYSAGLNNEISFEVALQGLTHNGCQLRALDKEEQQSATSAKLQSINATVVAATLQAQDDPSNGYLSFTGLVKRFGDKSIEVLKLDAEGAELEVVDQLFAVSICQFLVEVHATSASETAKWLEKVSSHGLYLFAFEVNAWRTDVSEYAFIHESCLSRYGVTTVYGRYLS